MANDKPEISAIVAAFVKTFWMMKLFDAVPSGRLL